MTLNEILQVIASSVKRKKGNFGVARALTPGQFALAVGSFRAVQIQGGFTIVIGLSRGQLAALRDECDRLLAENAPC